MALKQIGGVSWRYLPHIVNNDSIFADFIEKIMPLVRPNWNKDEVVTKQVNTGLGVTNSLIGFCGKKGDNDIVLLRVNGTGSEQFVDREQEVYMKCLFNQRNLGPPVYCQFENGLCYGYVPGAPLKLDRLKEVDVLQKISKSVASLHTLAPPKGCSKKIAVLELLDSLYAMLWENNRQSKRFKEVFISKENVGQEVLEMKKVIGCFVSPIVLCHNDLQSGNIIIDESGKVSFIDMEYAGVNYSACEIGNFFSEFAGIVAPDYTKYPNEEEQKRFLRFYSDEMANLKGDFHVLLF